MTNQKSNHLTQILADHFPEVIIGVIFICVSLYVAMSPANSMMKWYNNDDGFYYFKLAQNILAGKGVTFDGIHATNGFHPLWLIVCIPIFLLAGKDPILPLRMIVILFGILQAVSFIVIYQMFAQKLSKIFSFLLTAAFGLSWLVYNNIFTGGLESALSFFLIVILIAQGARILTQEKTGLSRMVLVGIFAGFAVLSRLDNLIFVGFFGIWLVFGGKRDANLVMADAISSILIATTASIFRIGYNLAAEQNALFSMIGLLTFSGIISNFFFGDYSQKPFRLPGNNLVNRILAGLLPGVITIIGSFLLFKIGWIETFFRGGIILGSLGWAVYAILVRGYFLDWLFPKPTQNIPVLNMKSILPVMKDILAFFLPVIIMTVIYMAWSQVNFGTPMPISGQIKHWWGTLGNTIYGSSIDNLQGIRHYLLEEGSPFGLLYSLFSPAFGIFHIVGFIAGIFSWLILALATVGLFVIKQKSKLTKWANSLAIFPLAAATIYRILYFYISGYVHIRSWYWTVETLFVFLMMVALFASFWEMQSLRRSIRTIAGVAIVIIVLVVSIGFFRNLALNFPWKIDPSTAEDYLAIPRWVESQTEPEAIIGTPGGGTLSYFIKDRTIVNLDGLMNSKEYFDDLKLFDTHQFMKDAGIRYIFINEYITTSSLPYSKIFKDHLTPVSPIFGKQLFLYK